MDIKKVIAKYPRIHLTPLPTPLEFAPQLTKMLGGPKIYVKLLVETRPENSNS